MQILADQVQFLQDVACHRNDVTANGIRLEDIEQLTRTGPD